MAVAPHYARTYYSFVGRRNKSGKQLNSNLTGILMIDFNDIIGTEFGVARAKPTNVRRVDPKTQFMITTKTQIALLNSGERATNWFKVQSDGTVVVTLRNGIRLLNEQKPQFVCNDVQSAIGYLSAALNACETGKLDEIFARQASK
jgi:hypothetical protein